VASYAVKEGDAVYGGGGIATTAQGNGNNATVYGGGGSGGTATTNANRSGGTGANGVMRIWEFA